MSDDALRQEFAATAGRAGLAFAPEREGVMSDAFKAMRDLMSVLHTPFAYAREPAYVASPPAARGGMACPTS